jgi:ABC-type bacteriocin/lantibiotic exporter with double-glycine peptidase domain
MYNAMWCTGVTAGIVAMNGFSPDTGELSSADVSVFESWSCGDLALKVVAELNGLAVAAADVDKIVVDEKGMSSLDQLERAGCALGLKTLPLEWRGGVPADLSVPAILPVTARGGRRHFVVLVRSVGNQVQIIDYPNDPVWVPASSLASVEWSSVALHISSDPQAIADLRRIAESDWPRTAGWIGGAVLLSIVIGIIERTWSKRRAHVPA